MTKRIKQAVCLFIQDEDGKILGVARRNEHEKFGLPGGKVDGRETHTNAAIRELEEETSVIVFPWDMYPVFTSICHGDDGNDFMCTTFFVERWWGEPKQGDAGPVKWLDPEVILSGPFGKYNLALILRLKEAKIIP